MAKTSPTQRTLKLLRDMGFQTAITEHWNSFVKRRQDLFGFIDLLAVNADQTIGVQATSASHHSARIEKISGLQEAQDWLTGGKRKIWVISWGKKGPRGKAKRWTHRITEVTSEGVTDLAI